MTEEGTNLPEIQEKQSIPSWLQNAIDRYDNGTYCHPAMARTKESKGKTPIDCSHWDKNTDDEAGFHLPYMTTRDMHSPKAAQFYDVTEVPKNGDPKGLDVKPGDKILFPGHVGKVISYDPGNGNGLFIGSQSHTGPAVTKFGPGANKDFLKPDSFLRPNDSGDPEGIRWRNDYLTPRYRVR